uniref:Uncharacterized protein n=1 Tax=Laticauda laticaudata TaxID=8630 RepID=A0A8C5R969_LATLA
TKEGVLRRLAATSPNRGGKRNSSQHLVTKPFPPPGLPPLPQPRAGSVRFHWALLAFPFDCADRGRPELWLGCSFSKPASTVLCAGRADLNPQAQPWCFVCLFFNKNLGSSWISTRDIFAQPLLQGHSARMPEENSPRSTPQKIPYQELPHLVNADGQYLFCRYWKPAAAPRVWPSLCLNIRSSHTPFKEDAYFEFHRQKRITSSVIWKLAHYLSGGKMMLAYLYTVFWNSICT